LADIQLRKQALELGISFAMVEIYESRVTRDELIRSLRQMQDQYTRLISRRNFPPAHILDQVRGMTQHFSSLMVQLNSDNGTFSITVINSLQYLLQGAKNELDSLPPTPLLSEKQ
jgi:hypothetical protein